MGYKLSILVCAVPSRLRTYTPKIVEELVRQSEKKSVEVLWLGDNKKRSVGQKRNDLLKLAQGEYVVFVDDDDWVDKYYVNEILKAVAHNPDVVCFKVLCKVEGKPAKEVVYDSRFKRDRNTARRYERLPNHIMCIRKDLALKAGFPQKSFGEDADFAVKLRPYLKRQYSIDKILYYYTFSHQISETQ